MDIVDKVRNHYEQVAKQYDKCYLGDKGRYYREIEEKRIMELAAITNKRFLDLGTGTGRIAFLAILQGAQHVVGVDVSRNIIRIAKSKAKRNESIDFLVMDGRNMGFRKNYFDAVLSIGTFEYVKEFSPFLKEIKRSIKKDGRLIFTVHNDCVLRKVFEFLYKKVMKRSGTYPIAKHQLTVLRKVLRANRFRVTASDCTFFIAPFVVWSIYHFLPSILTNFFIKLSVLLNNLLNKLLPENLGSVLIVVAQPNVE